MSTTIRGQVSAGGGRELGNSYACERTGTGTYTVTYDTAFEKAPVVVTTALTSSSGSDRITTLYATSENSFSVTTRKAKTSDREDCAFTFIASDEYNV